MKLTDQQLRFFKTFGYLGFPKLFSETEIATITRDFEYTIEAFGGGKKKLISDLCPLISAFTGA